jgi:hydroxyacylglutathione hydrolase
MRVEFARALRDNYIYFWIQGDRAAVVDPGEPEPVRKFLLGCGLTLDSIYLTHHHRDHVGGVEELLSESRVPVYSSEYDRGRLPFGTHGLKDGDTFQIFGQEARVIGVPGHTHGQIAYYFPRLAALFPGDTLFSAGCGRLFEGTPEQMFQSLAKLKRLPPETKIYFGHEYTVNNLKFVLSRERFSAAEEYLKLCEEKHTRGDPTTPTTIETELRVNPFFYLNDFEQFRAARDTW